MIRFACGTCDERLVVPDRHAGRKGKCPKCGAVNRVPAVGAFDEPAVAEKGTTPGTPAEAVASAPAAQRAGSDGRGPAVRPLVGPADPPAAYVAVNPLDDAGMPVWLKLVIVLGLLAALVLGIWLVFYLLIWSQIKLAA